MKVCSSCKVRKDHNLYHKDRTKKDGLQNNCKPCRKSHRLKNLDHYKEYQEGWRSSNPEYYKVWRKDNPDYASLWQKTNVDKARAISSKYRANKLSATPDWLTVSHEKQIKDLYWLAKDIECIVGEGYHVDHIVPLQGWNVCGLHVPWNLQVLPSDLNISKSNKTEDD